MQFLMGENIWLHVDILEWRGFIGFFYNSYLSGIIVHILFTLMCILAFIGLLSVIKWIFKGSKKNKKNDKNEDPYKEWIKTGKYK